MDEPTPLIVFGAGGHAAVVIDIVEADGGREIVAVADDGDSLAGTTILGHRVGPGEALPRGVPVVIAIGDNDTRADVARRLAAAGHHAAEALVHPTAVVSPRARLGAGTVVMPGAVVNARASIGPHGIVNTGSVIDHDCEIGDFVHLAPGVHLAGGVSVGARTQIGVGASVIPGVRIGAGALVGAGAVVIRDVADDVVTIGNPARVSRRRGEGEGRNE